MLAYKCGHKMMKEEKMTVKLIALDLDGTTLNSIGELNAKTKETIESAIKKGVHVVIATGRAYTALPDELQQLNGIEYVISANGAVTLELNSMKPIYTNYINAEAAIKAIDLLSKYDYMVEAFIDGTAYVDKKIFDNIESIGLIARHVEYVKRTRTPIENIFDYMLLNIDKIENININFGKQEDKKVMAETLKNLKNVTLTSSFEHNLEIGGETTSKADAIRFICNTLNVKIEETMACGDSPNDEEMLRIIGLPVAMGNAEEGVKRIAKYITGTNDEDGVAQAIEKFVLQ